MRLLLFCIVIASNLRAEVLPAPHAADIKRAESLVKEAFAGTDKTAKADTARRMLQFSRESNDTAVRYVLFRDGASAAADAGEAELLFEIVQEQSKHFDAKYDALIERVARNALTPEQKRGLVNVYSRLVDFALLSDNFQDALRYISKMETEARAARDPGLVLRIAERSKEIREGASEFARVKPAAEKLKATPDDAESALTLGRFYCFTRGDWTRGLPLLTISSDVDMKAMAVKEMGTNQPTLEIADGWWVISEKLPASQKSSLRRRVADTYRTLEPALNGLDRARVQARIAQAYPGGKRIDLMANVDPVKGAVAKVWTLQAGRLSCLAEDNPRPRFQFDYHPPAEFDYRIVFIRKSGRDSIALIAPAADRQFAWVVSYGGSSFQFEGTSGTQAVPPGSKSTVITGKPHEVVLKIRKEKIECYFDGQLITAYAGPMDKLGTSFWSLNDRQSVGIGAIKTAVEFVTAEVVENPQ